MKKTQPYEDDELAMIVKYLKLQYPKLIFYCHWLAGQNKNIIYAVNAKRHGNTRAFPDIFIAHPNKEFHGLFIELKRTGTKLLNKKGEYATPHIEEQAMTLARLRFRGYYAQFAVGFDETKIMIDEYMKIKVREIEK